MQSRSVTALSTAEIGVLYQSDPELCAAHVAYYSGRPVEAGIVSGDLAVLLDVCGRYPEPSLCSPGSIRHDYGITPIVVEGRLYFRNAIHRSATANEVVIEEALYWDSILFREIEASLPNYVQARCDSESRWHLHVLPVVEHSDRMARTYGAHRPTVIVAAWLHDITRMQGDREHHEETGAQVAEEFLTERGYPGEWCARVRECIRKHPAAYRGNRNLEEQIVASADGIAHLEHPLVYFQSAYGRRGLSLEEGASWIKHKLEESWEKVMLSERERVWPTYNAALQVLA